MQLYLANRSLIACVCSSLVINKYIFVLISKHLSSSLYSKCYLPLYWIVHQLDRYLKITRYILVLRYVITQKSGIFCVTHLFCSWSLRTSRILHRRMTFRCSIANLRKWHRLIHHAIKTSRCRWILSKALHTLRQVFSKKPQGRNWSNRDHHVKISGKLG